MIDKAKSKFSFSGRKSNNNGYSSGHGFGNGGYSQPSSGGYANTGRSSYPASGGYGGNYNSGGVSGGMYSGGGHQQPHTSFGGGYYPAQPGQYPISSGGYTTKKPSFFERAKQKIKSSGAIGKAVGYVKKDLGIGVVGPKPQSKILKYGRKAFEKLIGKKKVVAGAGVGGAVGYAAGSRSDSSPDYDENDDNSEITGGAIRGILQKQISVVEEEVDEIQNKLQASWNMSEAGSRYKIFEEPILKWEDAQEYCYNHGANLAVIDSDSKNEYVKQLLTETQFNSTQVLWFGLHTEIATSNQQKEKTKSFSNFESDSIPGCGVIDLNGIWSISSCSLQLPFICQAIKLNGEVFIP